MTTTTTPIAMSLTFVTLLLAFIGTVSGLQVTPGSPCASFCLDNGNLNGLDALASSTNASAISCQNSDFSDLEKGIKFKSCIECLAKSSKVVGEESDLHWYLYNIRYALSTCLFGGTENASDLRINSPCIIDHACGPLKAPLENDDLDPQRMDTYSYCDASNGVFAAKKSWTCVSCLSSSTEQSYLSNFVVALQAGCKQKPEPGQLISLTGSVFSTSRINMTEPTENIMDKPKGAGSDTLTTGAIVGIAVGGVLCLIGFASLFIMSRRRKKQMEKDEKADYRFEQASTPDPLLPPGDYKMSPSVHSQRRRGMSSSEYYDRLEEEIGGRLAYAHDPHYRSRSRSDPRLRGHITSPPPSYQSYTPSSSSRLKDSITLSPSPPSAIHRHTRSTPIALNPIAHFQESQLPARGTTSFDGTGGLSPPPPSIPPPPRHVKTPSLSMPSSSKLKLPKQYSPPIVVAGQSKNGEDVAPN